MKCVPKQDEQLPAGFRWLRTSSGSALLAPSTVAEAMEWEQHERVEAAEDERRKNLRAEQDAKVALAKQEHYSHRVAELFGSTHAVVQFDQPSAGAQLRGSDKYWSNSEPGLLFNRICLGEVAKPSEAATRVASKNTRLDSASSRRKSRAWSMR